MAVDPLSLAQIFYLFLLLVPGFLTLKLILYIGKVPIVLDQFDKTALSLIFSGFSVAILYGSYLYFIGGPTIVNPLATLSDYHLITGYILHLLFTILIGYSLGRLYNWYRGEEVYRSSLWLTTLQRLLEEDKEPISVEVELKNGERIQGQIAYYERIEGGAPSLLIEGWNEITEGQGQGHVNSRDGAIFVPAENISYVSFFESSYVARDRSKNDKRTRFLICEETGTEKDT